MSANFELTIRARRGWQAIDFKKIVLYWQLLAFPVWRDIKIRYPRILPGGSWAVLPLKATLIFSYVFNRRAHVQSDGPPYQLFAYAGLASWTFFSTSVTRRITASLPSAGLFSGLFIPLGQSGHGSRYWNQTFTGSAKCDRMEPM